MGLSPSARSDGIDGEAGNNRRSGDQFPQRHGFPQKYGGGRQAEYRHQQAQWRDLRCGVAPQQPIPHRISKNRIAKGLPENAKPAVHIRMGQAVADGAWPFEQQRHRGQGQDGCVIAMTAGDE